MQSKAKKNGKYPSKNKASPIDFETQISLRTYAPPKRSPSKKAFEKYKPRGLFSEFYGNLLKLMLYMNYPRCGDCAFSASFVNECTAREGVEFTVHKESL